ncbi:MAG TPA: class I SAM-dependent methyltransferase [Solirubrobacteraceae bacterium]|nr:class I SAM-dependent methyltransferase [Solirubrobacteraceae bacterium]
MERALDRLVTGDGPFTISECLECRYGVTAPQLRGAELDRYYGGEYFGGFYDDGSLPASGVLERARGRFRRIAARRRFRHAPYAVSGLEPGRVLDVGCGNGDLLAHYVALGWEAYGIDTAPRAVAAARRRGLSVHEGTFADRPWGVVRFDLIVFSHSLEHIPEPLDELRLAVESLAPRGRLAIALPNWSCWQRYLFGARWFHLDLPRHLQHFSPRALVVAADLLGLEVVEVGTSSTIISGAYSIHYVLAGRWTPGWKLWLSYALGVAAFPPLALVNRLTQGDCCYALLQVPSGDLQRL